MNIIYKALVGSHAYGTNTESSDEDYKGIYIQPTDELVSFKYKEQFDVNDNEVYYEIRRFIQLAMTANPSIIDMLFMPDENIITTSPQFNFLREYRNMFLTKKCRNSFGGYAVAQIQKAKGLNKKMNWEAQRVERKTILDFCFIITPITIRPFEDWLIMQRGMKFENMQCTKIDHTIECFNLYLNPEHHGGFCDPEKSNELRLSSVPKGLIPIATLLFNKDNYTNHCIDYKSYQEWLANRNTSRYVDIEGHNQKIDGKNLLHCRRLLDTAIEIATTKTITVKRPNAEYLLAIRKGKVDLEEIIQQAEKDIKLLDEVYANCDLPDDVDLEICNQLLLDIRHYE